MNDTDRHQGYILSTAISLKYMVKRPPQGYSLARLDEIYERVMGEGTEGVGKTEEVRSQKQPEEKYGAGESVHTGIWILDQQFGV